MTAIASKSQLQDVVPALRSVHRAGHPAARHRLRPDFRARATGNAWFDALEKPAIMPPGWVFGLAWTILYILLGLALALILHARGARGRGLALALFAPPAAAQPRLVADLLRLSPRSGPPSGRSPR
jgi:hypothetical protein